MMRAITIVIMAALAAGLFAPTASGAYDRRAVLKRLVAVKLAQNPPYVWKYSDCSLHAWDLVSKVLPWWVSENHLVRTTAALMARWAMQEVWNLVDAKFGDLLFFEKFGRIKHVGMQAEQPGYMVHASFSKGFIEARIEPYWTSGRPWSPAAIKRPPY